ncbi:MAG: hypothetical protein BalsKO_22680 [Balneolaceae bacterium]
MSVFSNTYQFHDFNFGIQSQTKKLLMKSIFLFICLILCSSTIIAQSLSDLSWMAGYWTSSEKGTTMEELWTIESGGLMLGLHRDVFSNGRSSFEFLNISKIENKITYIAQPRGGTGTHFHLIEVSDSRAVFENLEHDFPQRIIYSREGNKLIARIEDESGEKGMQWTWTKTNFDE